MADIFLSYARPDLERADHMAKVLAERGWSVFWDQRIPVGREFDRVIEQELAAARCVIVLWSRHSIASSWVRAEADEGARRGLLCPVRIEDVELPLQFRRLETARLVDWPTGATLELEQFLDGIAARLNPTIPVPPPPPGRGFWAEQIGRHRRALIAGSIAAGVGGLVAIGVVASIHREATTQVWYQTGEGYYYGRGVDQDYARAAKAFRRGAEAGDLLSEVMLGRMYLLGQGVPRDLGAAAQWYRKAADGGSPQAQNNLGAMYQRGEGVPVDDAEAVVLFRKAAEHGYAAAQRNLGIMYQEGRGVLLDNAEAVKWYRIAAGQGDANAQMNLGVMYENGHGVPQDDGEAVKWFRMAAKQRNPDAQNALRHRGLSW